MLGSCMAFLAFFSVHKAWNPDAPAVTFSNANNNLTVIVHKPAAKKLALDTSTQFAQSALYFFAGFGTRKALPHIITALNNKRSKENIRYLERCLALEHHKKL